MMRCWRNWCQRFQVRRFLRPLWIIQISSSGRPVPYRMAYTIRTVRTHGVPVHTEYMYHMEHTQHTGHMFHTRYMYHTEHTHRIRTTARVVPTIHEAAC